MVEVFLCEPVYSLRTLRLKAFDRGERRERSENAEKDKYLRLNSAFLLLPSMDGLSLPRHVIH
jgi:hypothetical protein